MHPEAQNWVVTARHDGWKRRFGCLHERTLSKTTDGFSITDTLRSGTLRGGSGPWPVEIGFLLAPDVVAHPDGPDWLLSKADGAALVRLTYGGRLAAQTEHGGTQPLRGWYSPAFGQKQPTTRLVFAGDLASETPQVFTFHFI